MINLEHSVPHAFIHIPKTGGTSVEQILARIPGHKYRPSPHAYIEGLGWHQHFTYSELREREGPILDSILSFAVVRNPWDRALSEYMWRIKKHGNWLEDPRNRRLYGPCDGWTSKRVRSEVSFRDFLLRQSYPWGDASLEQHMRPQMEYLIGPDGSKVDSICRFETIDDDFERIRIALGLPPMQLPHANKTNHDKYTAYYKEDPELISIVEDMYKSDIKFLNYSYGE